MPATYASAREARTNFRQFLDTASSGQSVTVQRDDEVFALTRADRLRQHFADTTAPLLRIGQDEGVWVVSMDHRPFVAEGLSIDEALETLIEDLREYADEWPEHYEDSPNHKGEWGLVQLVSLSTDDQLREWLTREAR